LSEKSEGESEVRQELERILTSRPFRRSARLRRFLRVTVEWSLAGKAPELKEYSLGLEVFDRGPEFDPRSDSIVRVEAGRLRRKLQEYYQQAGAGGGVMISFRPGTYVPQFLARPAPPPAASAPSSGSICTAVNVLPLINLSTERRLDLLCAAITEDTVRALEAVPGVKVLSRLEPRAHGQRAGDWRGMTQRRQGAGLPAVGRLVEGSVQTALDILRVSVRIVDAGTGQTVWSSIFEVAPERSFAVQEQVARVVAGAMADSVGGTRQRAPAPDAEAYALYVMARHHWSRMNLPGYRIAVRQFQELTRRFPEYALAHSGYADALAWIALWGGMAPARALGTAAREAHEALRLDPDLAQAYASLGVASLFLNWDWKRAIELSERAIELMPHYAFAYCVRGMAMLYARRGAGALSSFERAVNLEPLSPVTNRALGYGLYCQHRTQEAEQWYRSARSLQPDACDHNFHLALAMLQQHRYQEALWHARRCQPGQTKAFALGILGAALAASGHTEAAGETLVRLVKMSGKRYVDPAPSAWIYLTLGEKDRAVAALRRALEERSPAASSIAFDPIYDSLRGHRQFEELIRWLKVPGAASA
jgi:TolB-like protein/Flp pilus assembly protein TadD